MIVAVGAFVMAVAVGIRATLGVFVIPLSTLHGWPVKAFSFDLALQNLFWGFIQPLIGLSADVFGAGRIIAVGTLFFAGGLQLSAVSNDPLLVTLGSGIALGIGLAAASFPVILSVVGRTVSAENRSLAMGLAIAGGSFGQVILPPLAGYLVTTAGVQGAITSMAGIALLMFPLASLLIEKRSATATALATIQRNGNGNPLTAMRIAWKYRDYRLVVIGFFACGFQLAFISIHLPGQLAHCGHHPQMGTTALSIMGLFNIVGCTATGMLGNRYSQPKLLAALYFSRVVSVAIFLAGMKSETIVLVFSSIMGLTWLATVPLTSAIIARMFGPQYLGTLFGLAFLSHQIGSFFGAWLGGLVFDRLGNYTLAWILAGGLGLLATALHLPVDDSPKVALSHCPLPG